MSIHSEVRSAIIDEDRIPSPNSPITERKKIPAFVVSEPPRITVELDLNLALELGDFLVDKKPGNKALYALGCRLRDIVPVEKE